MRALWRLTVNVVLLVVIVSPVITAYLAPSSSSTVKISDFAATYAIDEQGTLTATESFTTDLEDVLSHWHAPELGNANTRLLPEDVRLTDHGDGRYTLTFRIPQTLSAVSGGSEFDWPIGGDWTAPIETTNVDVDFPTPHFTANTSAVTSIDGNRLTLTTGRVDSAAPVWIRATLDIPATGSVESLPWPSTWDGALGHSTRNVALLGILAILTAVLGFAASREAGHRVAHRAASDAPPAGLGPVQTYLMARGDLPEQTITTTLLHLAERGAIRIDQRAPSAWVFARTAERPALDAASSAFAKALGLASDGDEFVADGSSESLATLAAAESAAREAALAWRRGSRLTQSANALVAARILWVLCLAAVGEIVFATDLPTIWALPAAGFAIGGSGLWFRTSRLTRRGADVHHDAVAFERLITTNSTREPSKSFDHEHVYLQYVPYAYAFGSTSTWAAKFRTAMHREPASALWLFSDTSDEFADSADPIARFDADITLKATSGT